MNSYLFIKNFGKDSEHNSIDSLIKSLSNHVNKHISIIKKLPSGINKTFFVFVNNDKSLINSYTKENIPLSNFKK
jgi:hypothetical protein